MDKTLEVILVAVVLVVAAVILVGLLQGQAGSFGDFANQQTSSASCGITTSNFKSAVDCDTSTSVDGRAQKIFDENTDCFDASNSDAAETNVCN